MSHPFTYVKGEPIDLNRQDHRDEVIKRNKALEFALKHGVQFPPPVINIIVEAKLTCLKCGEGVYESSEYAYGEYSKCNDIHNHIPTLKCSSCKTKYKYYPEDGLFFPILKDVHKFLKTSKA